MPTIPQQQTIVQYVTNSAQLDYTFAFYAPLNADIKVYYQSSTATPVPTSDILSLGSQYTVTYNADPTTGGYITLLFTPVTGYYLTINRQVQASLETNFANAQNFNGANLDSALDRLLLLIQQNLNYITERNLSYVINTYLPSATPYTQLPPLPQNYFWVGSGAGVVAALISTVPSASVLQSMLASNSLGSDGARLVGYYNALTSTATTVQSYLSTLFNQPTINQPNIVGVTTASNAAAGSVGEVISSNVPYASASNFHNSTNTPITLISLTDGDWDVEGNVFIYDPNNQLVAVSSWSSTSNSASPDNSVTAGFNAGATNEDLQIFSTPILKTRYNVSTPTTVYLMVNAFTRSLGTMTACGTITARRVR